VSIQNRQQRSLFIAAFFATCILIFLGLGCADKKPSTPPSSYSSDQVDPNLLLADQKLQDLLTSLPAEHSPSKAVLVYSRMGKRFANINTRQEAEDKVFQLWEKDPENFIWIDLATNKINFLSRLDDYLKMIEKVTEKASPAIADFIYWRRYAWTRADAGDRLRQAEQKQAELTPLQNIWVQKCLAGNEKDRGQYEKAVSRIIKTMPEALELGGLPLVVYFWYDLSVNYMLMGKWSQQMVNRVIDEAGARGHGQ